MVPVSTGSTRPASLSHPLRKLDVMVAALDPSFEPLDPRPRHLRLVAPVGGPRSVGRPAGASGRAVGPVADRSPSRPAAAPAGLTTLDPAILAGVGLAVLILVGLLLLRLLQGSPPAAVWSGMQDDPREPVMASAGPGDQIRLVRPGDTLWAIAGELAPGSDPRPVVDRLVEVNGGSALAVGDELIIPADLVSEGADPAAAP